LEQKTRYAAVLIVGTCKEGVERPAMILQYSQSDLKRWSLGLFGSGWKAVDPTTTRSVAIQDQLPI